MLATVTQERIPKKRKLSTESSQASEDEQDNEPHETDSSQKCNAAPKQHGSTLLVDSTKTFNRRSARDKKKPKRYGKLTELSSSDESLDIGQPQKRRLGTSIASYSTPRQVNTETRPSPPHSVIPMTSPNPNFPAETIGNVWQVLEGVVLAIFEQDQPERSLQPHEF